MTESEYSYGQNANRHLRLEKYNALGNDFLVALLSQEQKTKLDTHMLDWAGVARAACDRKNGIGADGLLLGIAPRVEYTEWSSENVPIYQGDASSLHGEVSIDMVLYNSDGSEARVSGNGLSCLAHATARNTDPWRSIRVDSEFAFQSPFEKGSSESERLEAARMIRPASLGVTVHTLAGERYVYWENDIYSLSVQPKIVLKTDDVEQDDGSPRFRPRGEKLARSKRLAEHIGEPNLQDNEFGPNGSWNTIVNMPIVMPGPDVPEVLQKRILSDFGNRQFGTGDVGNTHLVIHTDRSLADAEVLRFGSEYESYFLPDGINIEFISCSRPGSAEIEMQVWERGAGITDACGTGAVVAATRATDWGLLYFDDGSEASIDDTKKPPFALVSTRGGTVPIIRYNENTRWDPSLNKSQMAVMACYVASIDYPILSYSLA